MYIVAIDINLPVWMDMLPSPSVRQKLVILPLLITGSITHTFAQEAAWECSNMTELRAASDFNLKFDSKPLLPTRTLSKFISNTNLRPGASGPEFQTDAEMLMARGPYENEVRKLWTEDSIDEVRLRFFGSHLGILTLLNFAILQC